MAGSADEEDIRRVITSYATAIDGRDWVKLGQCFTEDVTADYGPIGLWNSRDELVGYMASAHDDFGQTMHSLSNFDINVTGDDAVARTYFNALLPFRDRRPPIRVSGFYDDRLRRAGGAWRIAARTVVTAYVENMPTCPA
ncbi:hypothetical protein BSL82_11815 [Tardibacter chloracetimidivorans]|uniref:SnoaL-like domain-containing protein n=1 Tax=Tardibacter chloracetimidivorans TaxID=1921510 RepID=A0A1L3ZWA9_9SPHN|nr:nuclear transport factor 2 family protein [Tardibacter chloracetimidivorans]API59913.1 hypothetical protein BSL82_11815 [Tardibacter chloracetimidivorans]